MKPILITIVAAALMLFAGCATKATDPRVTLEPGLASDITVTPLVTRFTERGVIEAQTTVYNKDKKNSRAFEYRVQWTDAQGFPINTVTGNWTRFAIQPASQQTISIIGPSPEAVKFNIYIKAAKK